MKIGDEHTLDAQRCATDAPVPQAGRLTIECNGHVDLELVADAEALFMNDVIGDARRAVYVEGGLNDDFVFGKGLFGHEGEREVELSTRPGLVRAEGAKVPDHFVHLLGVEGVDEGGHDWGETAAVSPVADGGLPIDVEFGGWSGRTG